MALRAHVSWFLLLEPSKEEPWAMLPEGMRMFFN